MLGSFYSFIKENQRFFIAGIIVLCVVSAGIGTLLGIRKASRKTRVISEGALKIEQKLNQNVAGMENKSNFILPSPILPEVETLNTEFIYYFENIYQKPGPDKIIEIDPGKLIESYGGNLNTGNSAGKKKVDFFKIGNKKFDVLMYREMLAEP